MKIFLSVLFFIAFIVVVTLGFKRNNGFFNDDRKLGKLEYATPAAKEEVPTVKDSVAKKEPVKGEAKEEKKAE